MKMVDEKIDALLVDYFDGTLDQEGMAQVEALFRDDPELAAELSGLDETVALLQQIPQVAPPVDMLSNIFAMTTERRSFMQRFGDFLFGTPRQMAASAAAMVAAVVAVVLLTVPGIELVPQKRSEVTLLTESVPHVAPHAMPAMKIPTTLKKEAKPKAAAPMKTASKAQPKVVDSVDRDIAAVADPVDHLMQPKAEEVQAEPNRTVSFGLEQLLAQDLTPDSENAIERSKDLAGRSEPVERMDDRPLHKKQSATAGYTAKAKARYIPPSPSGRSLTMPFGETLPVSPVASGADNFALGGVADEGPAFSEGAVEMAKAEKVAETPLNIVKRYEGELSGVQNRQNLAVFDSSRWNNLWAAVHSVVVPAKPVPDIPFGESFVIAMFMGMKASLGFSIHIKDVIYRNGKLYVYGKMTQPKPGSLVPQTLSQPYSMVVVKKPAGLQINPQTPVEFVYE